MYCSVFKVVDTTVYGGRTNARWLGVFCVFLLLACSSPRRLLVVAPSSVWSVINELSVLVRCKFGILDSVGDMERRIGLFTIVSDLLIVVGEVYTREPAIC